MQKYFSALALILCFSACGDGPATQQTSGTVRDGKSVPPSLLASLQSKSAFDDVVMLPWGSHLETAESVGVPDDGGNHSWFTSLNLDMDKVAQRYIGADLVSVDTVLDPQADGVIDFTTRLATSGRLEAVAALAVPVDLVGGRLVIWKDANADRVVANDEKVFDESVPSGSGYPQAVSFGQSHIYVAVQLSKTSCRILRYNDANSDGIPDSSTPLVWADGSTVASFPHTITAMRESTDGLRFSVLPFGIKSEGLQTADTIKDANADGVADTILPFVIDENRPDIVSGAYAGLDFVWAKHWHPREMIGERVEVLDATDAVLGSALLAPLGQNSTPLARVQLSRALVLDEKIRLRYEGRTRTSDPINVFAESTPKVVRLDSVSYDLAQSNNVTLSGMYFSSTLEIHLIDNKDQEYSCAVTSLNAPEQVTVSIPALSSSALTGNDLRLRVREPGSGIEDRIVIVHKP